MKIFVLLIGLLFLTSPAPLEKDVKTENKNLEWLNAEANRIPNENKREDVQNFSLCIESNGGFELSIIREESREVYTSFFEDLDYSRITLGKDFLKLNCHSNFCIEYSKIYSGSPENYDRDFHHGFEIPLQQGSWEIKQLQEVLEKAIKEAGGKRLEDLVFDGRCEKMRKIRSLYW